MRANELRNGIGARGGIQTNRCLREAPYGPSVCLGSSVESSIALHDIRLAMPVDTIGLDDEARILEDEVGLPSTKHCAVHLEGQAPMLADVTVETEARAYVDARTPRQLSDWAEGVA